VTHLTSGEKMKNLAYMKTFLVLALTLISFGSFAKPAKVRTYKLNQKCVERITHLNEAFAQTAISDLTPGMKFEKSVLSNPTQNEDFGSTNVEAVLTYSFDGKNVDIKTTTQILDSSYDCTIMSITREF
jgi:hypothetical protein